MRPCSSADGAFSVAAYGIGSRIGSVVVRSGQWEFCTAVQYGGACITVGPGRYGEMPPALRGQVASVRRADAAMPPPIQAGGHPMPLPPGGLPPPPPSGQMPSAGVIPGPDAMQGWVRTVRGNEPVILFEHSNFDGRQVGIAGASVYAASKHGLAGFSQSLLREVKDAGIKVSLVNPGIIDTGFGGGIEGSRDPAASLHPAALARLILDSVLQPGSVLVDELTVHPLGQEF